MLPGHSGGMCQPEAGTPEGSIKPLVIGFGVADASLRSAAVSPRTALKRVILSEGSPLKVLRLRLRTGAALSRCEPANSQEDGHPERRSTTDVPGCACARAHAQDDSAPVIRELAA